MDNLQKQLYDKSKPKLYGGKKGLLIKIEKNYEDNCIILQQNGISTPEKMAIKKFYQAIRIIEKQNKPSHGSKQGTKRRK